MASHQSHEHYLPNGLINQEIPLSVNHEYTAELQQMMSCLFELAKT